MKEYNRSKQINYRNQQKLKNKNPSSINVCNNKQFNINQINNNYITKKSEISTKINIKNIQKNIIEDFDNELINKKIENYKLYPSKAFYHRKNYYSKDLTNYNNFNTNNSYLNMTNISSEHKNYQKYKTKYSIYNSSFIKINNSRDYSINDNKIKSNSNNIFKNSRNKRNFSKTLYDFKNIKYKMPNKKEEKRIPVIVVSKKSNYKTSTNFFNRRKYIIKIQSAWRGYFLRKIAVGSIKKYIGFIALIKYLEKIFFNNIEYLFYEFLFFVKKYDKRKTKYIYKKINYKDNKIKKGLCRNKNMIKNNNTIDRNNNRLGERSLKTNLFKSQDFELERDKSEGNITDIRQNSNKKDNYGLSIYFTNNEKDIKEKEKQIENVIINRKNIQHSKTNSEINNNIIYKPKKIAYFTKKNVEFNKSFKNSCVSKKLKIQKIINLIIKKCYLKIYPIFLYKLKILQKLNLIKFKLNTLSNLIKFIDNNKLKKIFLKKYRDNIITLKVKEEIFKENLTKINNITEKINDNDIHLIEKTLKN